MRLLLKAWNTNEHLSFGRYAIVDVTDEMLKHIAARRKIFLAAHEQDKELYEMYFWDCAAEFYGDRFGSNGDGEDDTVEESFDEALDEDEWVEISEDFETTGDEGNPTMPDRTDCDQMVIREEGVTWYAQDHYGDTTTMTVIVTYKDLFKDKL